jgi:LuxR family transcriptional regulator, maltose regulon positive regulatory protein
MAPSTTPIIFAKTQAPRLPDQWVARKRLASTLKDGLRHPLVLVSAPAGYGKSTFLSDALQGSGMRSAWISLDPGDDSVNGFLTYVAAAVESLRPGGACGRVLEALLSPDPPPERWALGSLLNAMGAVKDGFALVLDDYHVLESKSVHESVTFMVEHLPPRARLVISSREDPPLPIARWRAAGVMTEIRATDLELTHGEASAFLEAFAGLSLRPDDLERLEIRTEGWIAGLKMAALSLRGKEDVSAAISRFSGSNRYVLDYLGEEVLERQAPEVRRFLLATSILGRMSGPLCDAVTGGADGQSMLARLESSNLFITALDEDRRWYRYHQLFASILRNALAKDGPEALSRLHLSAGAWHESQGDAREAVDHFLLAGEVKRAAGALEENAALMLGSNRAAELMGLLPRLTAEALRGSPWLCVSMAWAALTLSEPEAAAALLGTAEEALRGDPAALSAGSRANAGRIRGHILSIRSFLAAARDDVTLSLRLSEEAERELPNEGPADLIARSVNSLNLASCLWRNGEIEKAAAHFESLAEAGRKAGRAYSFATLTSMGSMAEAQILLSRPDRAAAICKEAIEQASVFGEGLPLPAAALAHVVLGGLLYERDELDEAAETLEKGIELAGLGASRETVLKGGLILARVEQARGKPDASLRCMLKAEGSGPWLASPMEAGRIPAWKAGLALARGDDEPAVAWAKRNEAELGLEPGAPDLGRELDFLVLARVKTSIGECEGLPERLDAVIVNAERQGRMRTVIEALALKSAAQERLGDREGADAALERSLDLAEPAGYVRLFADEGRRLEPPMQRAASGRAHSRYASRLLAAMGSPAGTTSAAESGPVAAPGLIEALSGREMEVLRLIAAGWSNKEISTELRLAEGTVKKHASNIFGKLGVESRTRAVARSRELGIL